MIYNLMKFVLIFVFSLISGINTLKNEPSEIIEISLITEKDIEYEIDSNSIYRFVIENENYLYRFDEKLKDILKIYNKDNILETPKKRYFEKGEVVYINYLSNLNKKIEVKINAIPLYDKLNSLETINEDKYFSIKSGEESIAYFDSVDKNSKIFISDNEESEIMENMAGDFWTCSKDQTYFVKVELFDISVLKKYFYPLNLNSEIYIKDNEENFFYLQQSKTYTFIFIENQINKMIRLSDKTPNADVAISKEGVEIATLNKSHPYYELDKNYKGNLTLDIKDSNAFIEFLSEGNAEILDDISISNYKVSQNGVTINLKKTQKSFRMNINSNKNVKYSLSLGMSNKNNFYYISSTNPIINSQKNELILQYLAPFKYIDTLENEFLCITINFEKEEQEEITISYSQFSEIDELLDLDLAEGDCVEALESLATILDLYVYLDIAKNPPEIEGYPNYHHKKVDLIEEIESIPTKDRKFYEFYQDVKKVLTTTRDLHFNIACLKVDNIVLQYQAYLPFNFRVGDYNGEKRIFIEKNGNFDEFEQQIKTDIESRLSLPLKKINNIDPFDYIQNWSQFSSTKNPHSQFTYIIDQIPSFYLYSFPVNYWDITSNDYEFEDNFVLRLSYKLDKPNSRDNNDQEFNQYFFDEVEKSFFTKNMPPINEIKENFLVYKGIKMPKKIIKESEVKWDVIHDENGAYLKCKVDNDNKANVVVQNSFSLEYGDTTEKIFKCAELFHKNNYPIIIIETKNGGGDPNLSLLMIQLFQIREVERTYSAYRVSDYAKEFYKRDSMPYVDPETCSIYKVFEDLGEETDYYDNDGITVEHKRTRPFIELLSKTEREALNNFRKEYINSKYLKRPTDIIILTDSFSYSATSTFIKGFQNIGGAITVGYYGNPKLDKIEFIDASQSDSGVMSLGQNLIGNMLFRASITSIEIFNDLYQGGNPMPREYQLNPVDDRVDIYSKYSDELYEKFVTEGIKIHKKFNEQNYCNSNDKKLIFHDNNNCYNIPGKEKAHGGYICGNDNKWDTSQCVPYYCDIGYYYDLYSGECVEECKSDSKAFYLHENTFSKKYNVKKDETYEFFTVNSDNCYMFKSSEDNLYVNSYKRPRMILMKGSYNQVIINPGKNSQNDFELEINSFKSDFSFSYVKGLSLNMEDFIKIDEKLMLIIQLSNEHILSLYSIGNISPDKVKYAKYKDEMNYENIINGDNKYFQSGSNKMIRLEKNEVYILHLDFNINDPAFIHINFDPVEKASTIPLDGNSKNFIYLQKNKKYTLDLKNMRMNTMLKLSKQTINSEINITNYNIQLNSNNYYYEITDKIKNDVNMTLELEVNKEDAFLELLYKEDEIDKIDILDFEQKTFKLNKTYNLISIPKKYATDTINFEIKSENENASNYTIYQGYSLLEYIHFPSLEENDFSQLNAYSLQVTEPYKDKSEFMDEEYYTVMIILANGNLDLKIQIKEKEDDKDSKGFPSWAIALIVVGGVILIALFVFILIYVCKCCSK